MATAINLMQAWLDKAVAFRADMLQSEVKFYLFLVDGERGAKGSNVVLPLLK